MAAAEYLQKLLSDIEDAYAEVWDDGTVTENTEAIVSKDIDEAADALRAAIRHLRGSNGS